MSTIFETFASLGSIIGSAVGGIVFAVGVYVVVGWLVKGRR